MKVPNAAHTSKAWRIHEVVPDFRLEDVWALPTPGGPDDFPRLVELMTSIDPLHSPSRLVRTLFGARLKIGQVLRLDDHAGDGAGRHAPTVRDRLPDDLRHGPRGPAFKAVPFVPLFQTDDEFAAELANRTMHGVVHVSWVPDEAGGYHGRLAIYVKRNGRLGAAYMAAITPFRRVLYPPFMRSIGQAWQLSR